DPNNPLGTIIEDSELYSIAEILRKHTDILIILDEAYAEMRLDGQQHMSLLRIAPDLSSRIVLMRSATKALSAAGERMAALI
ncbi:aminotransferase class I/II-fold pyridoxal phosphate-dependent enzyme, partial [Acinetobacter baumannii]